MSKDFVKKATDLIKTQTEIKNLKRDAELTRQISQFEKESLERKIQSDKIVKL